MNCLKPRNSLLPSSSSATPESIIHLIFYNANKRIFFLSLSLSLFGFLSIFSPALKFEELVTLIRMDYFHSIPTQVLLLLPFLHISMDDFSTNFYGSDGKKRREEKKKKRFID